MGEADGKSAGPFGKMTLNPRSHGGSEQNVGDSVHVGDVPRLSAMAGERNFNGSSAYPDPVDSLTNIELSKMSVKIKSARPKVTLRSEEGEKK